MSSYYYDNQVPVYRNVGGTTSMTLDSVNNELIIENTTIPKKIIINSTQFSNGTQSLPYTQMYEKINGCNAVVYPAPVSTTLQVENKVVVSNTPASQSVDIDGGLALGTPTITCDNPLVGVSRLQPTTLILNDNVGGTDVSVSANGIINSSNVINIHATQLINNSSLLYNNGGYIQSTATNQFNPTTLPSDYCECFVIKYPANPVVMNTFSNYAHGGTGGWTCKVFNATNASFTITSPDANFTSWLQGVIGLSYPIPANSGIQITALSQTLTGLLYDTYFVEDCSGYRTNANNANATHYLTYVDHSTTGVGLLQKNSGFQVNPNAKSLTITDGTNSTVITPTSNPANSLAVTSDNTNTTCYIPFTKTSSGQCTFFLDDTTGPLTYNPSTATLTATTFSGTATNATNVSLTSDNTNGTYYIPFYKQTAGTSANQTTYIDDSTTPLTYNPSTCQLTVAAIITTNGASSFSLGANATSGSITIGNASTSGSINIGINSTWTTGNVNIGTSVSNGPANINLGGASATNINLKSQTILSSTLATSIVAPSTALQLGFQTTTLGASFTTTSLLSSTNTNLMSYTFTSANFGTYIFNCAAIITPTDTTAVRQVELSISTASATIQNPYYDMEFIPIGGSAPQLQFTRMLQIYANTTVYLVGYCNGSTANVQTTSNNGLFSYTRIA